MTHIVQHLNWGAEALWQQLTPLLPGISVEVQARVESTNTRLLERARSHSGQPDAPVTRPGELDALAAQAPLHAQDGQRTPHGRRAGDVSPCLLVAEEQTRGRGRMGRDWLSSAGASLTFSLALPLAPQQWGGLSLAVGLALAQALEPLPDTASAAPPRLMLKWPNDLWLMDGVGQGRKLGGVLIETISVGEHRLCVVGVGLNVLPRPAGATGTSADNLTHGYACLQELMPDITAPAALARVAPPLVRALRQFEREGFAPLAGAYRQRDLLLGQRISTSLPDGLHGLAEGVDEQGALRLRSGELHRVVSGEVSVRLHHEPSSQSTGRA
jgi:BirA family transcriptional regulator, biotin operon repressor / biotin---[acetyl-CoA-carboxylase] ligase